MIDPSVCDRLLASRSLAAFAALCVFSFPSVGMAVNIAVGSASGQAGDVVSIDVTLATMGDDVAATDNRITFDADTPIIGCTFNPALASFLSGFSFAPLGCTPGTDCVSVRAVLLTFPIVAIPDGSLLYSCDVAIGSSAAAGSYPLACSAPASSDPGGTPLATTCSDGEVTVTAPPALDHFKCYKAKDLKNPKFVATTVALSDQFGVNDGMFEVKKPFLFCNPADKNGEGISNPVDHLACYKVKGPALDKGDRPKVEVDNQLGGLQLEVTKPFLLCVPSTKTVIP
jgi:hypothetical protein